MYVCSTTAPVNLHAMLGNMGFAVRMSALYDVQRAQALPDVIAAALKNDVLDGAVFFSADEARGFAQLVQRAGLEHTTQRLIAIVAAPVVAAPLTILKFAKVVTATKSDAVSVIGFVSDALLPQPEPIPEPEHLPEPELIPEPVQTPELPPEVIVTPEPSEVPGNVAAPDVSAEPLPFVEEATVEETSAEDTFPENALASDVVEQTDATPEPAPEPVAETEASVVAELNGDTPALPQPIKVSLFAAVSSALQSWFARRASTIPPQDTPAEIDETAPLETAVTDVVLPSVTIETHDVTEAEPQIEIAEPEILPPEQTPLDIVEPIVVSALEAVPVPFAPDIQEPKDVLEPEPELAREPDVQPEEPVIVEPVISTGLEAIPLDVEPVRADQDVEEPSIDEATDEAPQDSEQAAIEGDPVGDVPPQQTPSRGSMFAKFATFMSRYRGKKEEPAREPVTADVSLEMPPEPEAIPEAEPITMAVDVTATNTADVELAEPTVTAEPALEEIVADITPQHEIIATAATETSPEPIPETAPEIEHTPQITEPHKFTETPEIKVSADPSTEAIAATISADADVIAMPKQSVWSKAGAFFGRLRTKQEPETQATAEASPSSPDDIHVEAKPSGEDTPPIPEILLAAEPEPQTYEPEVNEVQDETVELAPKNLDLVTEKAPPTEPPLDTMPPDIVTPDDRSLPSPTEAPPEEITRIKDPPIETPPPIERVEEVESQEDRLIIPMVATVDQMNADDINSNDAKSNAELAKSRTGGRSARLLAEDAADARARNQRFKFGSESADTETATTDAAATQQRVTARRGAGAVPYVVGVAVLGVVGYYTSSWWLPLVNGTANDTPRVATAPTTPTAPADQMATLQARTDALAADLVALNKRMGAVEQRPAGAGDAATVADLSKRIAALESAPAVDTTAPEGLSTSVTNQARQLASVTARVATLEAALGNAAKLEDVASRLSVLEGKSAEANSVLALGDRLASLEKRDAVAATALVLATAQLRDAAQSGRAYSVELETVGQLAARADVAFDASALKADAAKGLTQIAVLKASFPDAATKMIRADVLPDTTDWLRRILDRIYSIVSVRPFGTLEGDSVTAIVARAEQALKNDNLAQAVTELETLKGAAADAAQGWLVPAKAYVTAQKTIDELSARSVGAMSAISRIAPAAEHKAP